MLFNMDTAVLTSLDYDFILFNFFLPSCPEAYWRFFFCDAASLVGDFRTD